MYECMGGPMDGKRVAMHEGRELRVAMAPEPQGVRMLTDDDASKPFEERIGLYILVQVQSQPHPYLRWMGEL
jgi:hypothetical protein